MTTVDEARAALLALAPADGPFEQRVEALIAAVREESGHRIEGGHDCFVMLCRNLGHDLRTRTDALEQERRAHAITRDHLEAARRQRNESAETLAALRSAAEAVIPLWDRAIVAIIESDLPPAPKEVGPLADAIGRLRAALAATPAEDGE